MDVFSMGSSLFPVIYSNLSPVLCWWLLLRTDSTSGVNMYCWRCAPFNNCSSHTFFPAVGIENCFLLLYLFLSTPFNRQRNRGWYMPAPCLWSGNAQPPVLAKQCTEGGDMVWKKSNLILDHECVWVEVLKLLFPLQVDLLYWIS